MKSMTVSAFEVLIYNHWYPVHLTPITIKIFTQARFMIHADIIMLYRLYRNLATWQTFNNSFFDVLYVKIIHWAFIYSCLPPITVEIFTQHNIYGSLATTITAASRYTRCCHNSKTFLYTWVNWIPALLTNHDYIMSFHGVYAWWWWFCLSWCMS